MIFIKFEIFNTPTIFFKPIITLINLVAHLNPLNSVVNNYHITVLYKLFYICLDHTGSFLYEPYHLLGFVFYFGASCLRCGQVW